MSEEENTWINVRFLQAKVERLTEAARAAEDYITHANNWPLGTRIDRRPKVLALLRAELAARPSEPGKGE